MSLVRSRPSEIRSEGPGISPRQLNLSGARWALCCVFLLGYLASERSLGPLNSSFLVLTVLNTTALAMLLTRLSAPLEKTLWVWSCLLVLLTGLFLKMFWFAWNIDAPQYINANFPELRWVDRERVLSAYPWATLGFVTFCVAAAACLTWSRHLNPPVGPKGRRELVGASIHIVVLLTILYLASSLVQLRLGYGLLGANNPVLPGRLGTFLTFFRQSAVPGLLLLCLWVLDRSKPGWARFTAMSIVGTGLIDALISTSRGSLPYLAAPILLLWVLTNRLSRQRKVALIAVALIAVVLFPILSASRYRRITQSGGEKSGSPSVKEIVDSAFFIVTRPSGAEGVWYGVDHRGEFTPSRVLTFLRPGAMTTYYTRNIVGVRQANDNRAPGIIGALMILGGAAGVVVMMIGLVFTLQGLWAVFRRLQCWPVALALAAPAFAVFFSGGLDFILLSKLCLQVVGCEIVYRKLLKGSFYPTVPNGSRIIGR